jgi:hypothetical protein
MKRDRSESFLEVNYARKRLASKVPETQSDPNATDSKNAKLRKFNEKFLANFQKECRDALDNDAEGDLRPLFDKYGSKYSRLRETRAQRETQYVQGL